MELYILSWVVIVGLIHGLEPGHGWPLAIIYSLGSYRSYLRGLISSGIISLFHFISTVAVVAVFLIFSMFINIPEIYLDIIAVTLLVGLGIYILLKTDDDEIKLDESVNLRKVAYIAFIIGFAHEEEFMLIGLILSGVDPLSLIIAYSGAVTLSITTITLAGIRMYEVVKARVDRVEDYLRYIAGVSLILMGVTILLGDILKLLN